MRVHHLPRSSSIARVATFATFASLAAPGCTGKDSEPATAGAAANITYVEASAQGSVNPADTPAPAQATGPAKAPTPMRLLGRDELRAYELALLARKNQYSRGAKVAACAPAQSPAAQAVLALFEGPDASCARLDPQAADEFGQFLSSPSDSEDPRWDSDSATAIRACRAQTVQRLLDAPDLSTTCRPGRPGTARIEQRPLDHYKRLLVLSRAVALEIHDLAGSGRTAEAVHLALRMNELSQALSRGQMSYIDAVIAMSIMELPMDRLRLELAQLGADEGLTRAQVDAFAQRVDALLGTETGVLDAIRGDHLQMSLTTMWASDQPEHPAVRLARGDETGQAIDVDSLLGQPLGASLKSQPGFEDPLAIMWSAHVSLTEELLGMCTGVPLPTCRDQAQAWGEALRIKAQPREVLGVPVLPTPQMVFDLVRGTIAMAVPEFTKRAELLAALRVHLEVLRAPNCPSQAQLDAAPYQPLRASEYVAAPLVAVAHPSEVYVGKAPRSPGVEFDTDQAWRVRCAPSP